MDLGFFKKKTTPVDNTPANIKVVKTFAKTADDLSDSKSAIGDNSPLLQVVCLSKSDLVVRLTRIIEIQLLQMGSAAERSTYMAELVNLGQKCDMVSDARNVVLSHNSVLDSLVTSVRRIKLIDANKKLGNEAVGSTGTEATFIKSTIKANGEWIIDYVAEMLEIDRRIETLVEHLPLEALEKMV